MASPKPIITLPDVSSFAVAKSTRLVVRLDDLRSGLRQECMVERARITIVNAVLRKYGGARFTIRVDLDTRTVSLVSPDYSWLSSPEDIPAAVARTLSSTLATRKPTCAVKVTRSHMKITAK